MTRASLLAPPVGWMCHACGYTAAEKPERCPKCSNSAFERTGAAEAVREAEKESDRLAGPEIGRTAMARTQFDCVDGCGAFASKKGGRCRTCAGLLRRKKRAGRPAPATRPAKEAAKKDLPHSPLPLNSGALGDVATALRAAGFNVADVRVAEATLLVRLTA